MKIYFVNIGLRQNFPQNTQSYQYRSTPKFPSEHATTRTNAHAAYHSHLFSGQRLLEEIGFAGVSTAPVAVDVSVGWQDIDMFG